MKKVVLNRDGLKNMPFKVALFLAAILYFTGCKQAEMNRLDEDEKGAPPRSLSNVQMLAGSNPIKVLSFNTRHNAVGDPQSITERQGLIRQIIVDNSPDVFGVQEFTDTSFKTWFVDQMAALGYEVYISPDVITSSPKAIFYKINRFTRQGGGSRVLGPNPPVINTVTWVILLDNATSNRYFISNSHWQYDSQSVRQTNSEYLVNIINQYNTDNLPVITFGDFNTQPGTPEITTLKTGLDVMDALGDFEGGMTIHGWDATGDYKLDWIMSDRSMAFTSSQVITTSYLVGGVPRWPSDHWPVMATFIPGIFGDTHDDVNGASTSAATNFYFADVNGDGKKDKINWNPTVNGGKPQVFLSNSNGTFGSAIPHTTGASTYTTTRYYYADLNGDGKADEILWTPTLNSGHTRVLLATTNGNFSSTIIDNPEGASAGTTTIYNFADVNGDGKADKIYWNANVDAGKTRVYLATSGGSFSSTVVLGAEGTSTTAGTRFYYADVNEDGKADKIVWHPALNSGKPMVYLSDGDGTFTASSTFSNSGAGSASESTVFYFADINGDGRADKIYWNPGAYLGKLKVYYSTTSNVFDGPIYSLRGVSENMYTDYYFADITGDGKADQNRWNYTQYGGGLKNNFAK
ncbi:FG-GAP-like repeat-containing protein [Pedobacter heparinus]|uniref:FG-GAP-like repeat-containing protein n=1 Tax=Pedobacter heparinus TaxID=984 RepID=UPI00292FDEF8|nr:FG-GAP-like repeat-containing protein [Pedobacter heparinus]